VYYFRLLNCFQLSAFIISGVLRSWRCNWSPYLDMEHPLSFRQEESFSRWNLGSVLIFEGLLLVSKVSCHLCLGRKELVEQIYLLFVINRSCHCSWIRFLDMEQLWSYRWGESFSRWSLGNVKGYTFSFQEHVRHMAHIWYHQLFNLLLWYLVLLQLVLSHSRHCSWILLLDMGHLWSFHQEEFVFHWSLGNVQELTSYL